MVLCIEHSECYLSKSIILIGWIRDMLLYYMYKASRCQTNCYINQVKALNFTSMMFLYTFILCFIIFIRYTLLNIITLLSDEFNFFFCKMPLPTFLCYGILILILTEHIRLWQILPNIWINDLYRSEKEQWTILVISVLSVNVIKRQQRTAQDTATDWDYNCESKFRPCFL